MKQNYSVTTDRPTAFITVKRKRVKQFGTIVYLNDQTEFEIEFHNPTTAKVLAEIWINGKQSSSGGIVIKPGQRIFLERYLDTANNFKYEVYKVSNTEENRKAIHYNGDVEIKFFREKTYDHTIYYSTNCLNINATVPSWNTISDNLTLYNSTYDGTLTCSTSDITTGIIGKGNASGQEFVNSNDQFEYFHTWISKWKIMPYETKPTESRDLIKFCTSCGEKLKSPSWSFCPHCSAPVEKELDLNSLSREELIKLIRTKI